MLTPTVLILAYLSSTFLMGLILGWLLWQFGGAKASTETEVQYWRDRLNQSRAESHLYSEKIATLEKERDNLKKRLSSAFADKFE